MVFFPSSQTTKVDVTKGTRASLLQPTHGSGPCTRESCSAGLRTARTRQRSSKEICHMAITLQMRS